MSSPPVFIVFNMPHTQLVLVSLLPLLVELLLELLELLEHPVLFMHNVCRLSLPNSYGNDEEAFVVFVVALDLSFSLSNLPNSRCRVLLITQMSTITIKMTEKAPINEPSRVCLSSTVENTSEVGGEDDNKRGGRVEAHSDVSCCL
jgi:hypothetical protein